MTGCRLVHRRGGMKRGPPKHISAKEGSTVRRARGCLVATASAVIDARARFDDAM